MPTPAVPDRKAVTPPWNSRLSKVEGKEKEVGGWAEEMGGVPSPDQWRCQLPFKRRVLPMPQLFIYLTGRRAL